MEESLIIRIAEISTTKSLISILFQPKSLIFQYFGCSKAKANFFSSDIFAILIMSDSSMGFHELESAIKIPKINLFRSVSNKNFAHIFLNSPIFRLKHFGGQIFCY